MVPAPASKAPMQGPYNDSKPMSFRRVMRLWKERVSASLPCMQLEQGFRDIKPDRNNLLHGRLPPRWFDAVTWYADAVEASTPSAHLRRSEPALLVNDGSGARA